MFRRILPPTLAAAVLVASSALANEPAGGGGPPAIPPCCERMAMQLRTQTHEHHGRAEVIEKTDATPAREAQETTPRVEEDLRFLRSQSEVG